VGPAKRENIYLYINKHHCVYCDIKQLPTVDNCDAYASIFFFEHFGKTHFNEDVSTYHLRIKHSHLKTTLSLIHIYLQRGFSLRLTLAASLGARLLPRIRLSIKSLRRKTKTFTNHKRITITLIRKQKIYL